MVIRGKNGKEGKKWQEGEKKVESIVFMKNSKSNKLSKIIIDKIYAFGRAIEGEAIK